MALSAFVALANLRYINALNNNNNNNNNNYIRINARAHYKRYSQAVVWSGAYLVVVRPMWHWITVTDRQTELLQRASCLDVCVVVKVRRDARERGSCTSDYWQIALFLHFRVHNNAQEPTNGGPQEPLQERSYIRPSDNICAKWLMTVACCRQMWHRTFTLASASDGPCPRGWGPLWSLGAHAEFPHLIFSTLTTACVCVAELTH